MATKDISPFEFKQSEPLTDISIGILVSQWNSDVTNKLLSGAINTLGKYGVKEDQLQIEYVPGSYELPLGAQMLIEYAEVDAVICLGAIIQGETRHFEFISQAVSGSLSQLSLEYSTPVIFGVLTTDNQEQALDRAGGKLGNKGDEAAISVLKMLALEYKLLKKGLPEEEEPQA